MTDSDSDPIDTSCHEAVDFWKKSEKGFLESKRYWLNVLETGGVDVVVNKDTLTDLFLHVKMLRHILSCDECSKIAKNMPLKVTRNRT